MYENADHRDYGDYDKYPDVLAKLQSHPQYANESSGNLDANLWHHEQMVNFAKSKGYKPSDVKIGQNGASYIEHRLGPWTARYTGFNRIDIHHDSIPDTPNLSPAGHHVLASMGYRTGPVGHAEVIPGVGHYVPDMEKADAKVQPHHVQSALERFVNERSG